MMTSQMEFGIHSPQNGQRLRQTMAEKGWVIIKGVFSPEEIDRLRAEVKKSVEGKYETNDLLSNPYLSHHVHDDRMLAIARSILGDRPVYFGNSSFKVGGQAIFPTMFHKDCADIRDGNAPDWKSPYSLINVAVYLQDHSRHSGGVSVRDGSHRTVSMTSGNRVYVRSEPGDVVVWYLTTSHNGPSTVLKHSVVERLPDQVIARLHRFGFLFEPQQPGDRIGLFTVYGIRDPHLERYLEYLRRRTFSVASWKKSAYSSELLNEVQAKPFDVIHMNPEAAKIDIADTRDEEIQLPY